MSIADVLNELKSNVAQCDNLIANAHKLDSTGSFLFPRIDREQITVAAFLNVFIAWETFLENSLAEFMTGGVTTTGSAPIRYVAPRTIRSAKDIVTGVMRYFDYGNHMYFRKLANIYFEKGYPFEVPLSAIISDLDDLRAMRNASAHITSTTQAALESLALRVLRRSSIGITLYQVLTAIRPSSTSGETVLLLYKSKLIVAAELIARG
jgi:hypothetical protein